MANAIFLQILARAATPPVNQTDRKELLQAEKTEEAINEEDAKAGEIKAEEIEAGEIKAETEVYANKLTNGLTIIIKLKCYSQKERSLERCKKAE